MRRALLGIAAVLLLGFRAAAAAAPPPAPPGERPSSFARLARQVAPAVVNIFVAKQVHANGPESFFPFNMEQRPQRGQGSGFIIDPAGFIVTNYHVVEGVDEIRVRLLDRREFTAHVLGTDPKTDLALLKIEAANLPYLRFGDSDALQVGDWVLAVGNPLGLGQTVTAGIVSAKGRSLGLGPYDEFIQTDASINLGNSGGPLINMNGEVVGVNSLIAASGQGIGFAIPSSLTQSIISQLKQTGKVTRAWLGVMFQPMTQELAEGFGLDRPRGALISQVIDGSPAQKAGLQNGDVVVEFEGREIDDATELPILIASTPIGKEVALRYIRNKKTTTLTVKLAAQPEETAARADVEDHNAGRGARGQLMILGMELTDVTDELAHSLGIEPGRGVLVKAVKPFSSAAIAGLARGDLILTLNNQRCDRAGELIGRIEKLPSGSRVLLYVQRGDRTYYVALSR